MSLTHLHPMPALDAINMDGDGTHVLEITTDKFTGRLITTMNMFRHRPDGSTETIIFGDYNEKLAVVPCKRATKKAIETAHANALESFETKRDQYEAIITAHYS